MPQHVVLIVQELSGRYSRELKPNDTVRFPHGVRFLDVDLPEQSMRGVHGFSILTTQGGQIYDSNGWVRLRSTP